MKDAVTSEAKIQGYSLLESFSSVAVKHFGGLGKKMAARFPSMREDILKSNLRITPEALGASSVLATIITCLAAAALTVVGVLLHFLVLVTAWVSPLLVMILFLNAAKISQSSRAAALENELPFIMGFIQVLVSGGSSPIEALRRIASMHKVFPAASKEANRILVDVDVFGLDPVTALANAAKRNPNKSFADFLYGYTTIVRTGGDLNGYVSNKMAEIYEGRNAKMKQSTETIGTFAEAYVTLTSVLGISLFMLYEIQAVLTHNSGGLKSLLLFSFVLVPLISVMFIWIMDGSVPKQPYMDYRPYKLFAVFSAVGAALFLVPLRLPLYEHAAIALMASVSVPGFLAVKYDRERSRLENALPNFIRDVSEGRKIGLSPAGSIEQLYTRNYGSLTRHVKKVAAQLSWGLPLSRVISGFVSEVHSWLTKVVGTLMGEVIAVGGGDVASFQRLADFTRKIEGFESEKKSTLRPYVFVVYMAGILIVVTTYIMVYLLRLPSMSAGSSLGITPTPPATINLLLTAAIFESWVVGFVAGKMGEGSVAQGFKHSFILVLIGLITMVVAGHFLSATTFIHHTSASI